MQQCAYASTKNTTRSPLAPGEAPEAVCEVELAVAGAAEHPPEAAPRRADAFAFGGDHRDCGSRLVASHGLASIDPGWLANAKLLTNPVGGFDEISPIGRSRKDVR